MGSGRPGSPGRRPAAARKRVAISLAISALAHAGLLAWVRISVPPLPESPRFADRSAPLTAEPAPAERQIRVIEIRPPGVLPSGGAAATEPSAGGATAPQPVALPAGTPVTAMPAPIAPPAAQLVLASAAVAPLRLPSVERRDLEAEKRSTRPNRGIIQRGSGAGVAGGRAGRGSAGRGGLGPGGGGVTIMGPGTDCITTGLVSPGTRNPLALPDRRASGAGAGGGIGRGRIGRSGR